jgi:hypothetical protein
MFRSVGLNKTGLDVAVNPLKHGGNYMYNYFNS